MSFEIDHRKLTSPPRKCDQEAITTFWGIYRWPFKSYNRYSQLEGLEQTADETRTMAKALQFLSTVQELGLSLDGGLGWLAGPDINTRVEGRGGKPPVFGASKFVPETPTTAKKVPSRQIQQLFASVDSDSHLASLTRILEDSGFTGEDLQPAMQLLKENEGVDIWEEMDCTLPASHAAPWGVQPSREAPALATWVARPRRRMPPHPDRRALVGRTAMPREQSDDEMDDESDGSESAALFNKGNTKSEAVPLKPNDLTNAQREMLLEMEWAQNAFMQSWAIAIMDNLSHMTFNNITTLNIARIPTRHLSVLRRGDFWDSLPGLESFSLAVIPDWREVKKEATSWVQDANIAPSDSLSTVFDIIHQHISWRESIKALHFEWLCGGENASGLFSRNQNVLAAPVVVKAMHMVDRTRNHQVLDFPHIEHLSLKNCWFSPHVLSELLARMREQVLHSVTFDSVSLTATLPANARPNPITRAQQLQNIAQNFAGNAAANNAMVNVPGGLHPLVGIHPPLLAVAAVPTPPVAAPPPNVPLDWLAPPRMGSWAGLIDSLTPGPTLAEIRYSRDHLREPEARQPTQLTKLVFNSCGYAKLPLDFDQSTVEAPAQDSQANAALIKRQNEIDVYMMKPLEAHTLASIINHIDPVETATLENAWNMTVGWRNSQPELLGDALLDGVTRAGYGRFEGCIEVAQA